MDVARGYRRPLRSAGKCATCGERRIISVGPNKVEKCEGPEFGDGDESKTQELDDEFAMLACSEVSADCPTHPDTTNNSHFSDSESERRRSVNVCV